MEVNKKKIKLWEKLFVIASIVIIIAIIGIYTYRTIYYYRDMNYVAPMAKLKDVIINPKNIVYSNDGLYKKDDNNFYYYGKDVNNYVLFSGRIWRIVGIDNNGIKLITDDNQTSLVWGNNTDYDKSIIYRWLNDDVFLKSLSDQDKIKDVDWCNTAIDINEYNCKDTVNAKVGLLTTDDYLNAGGVNSFLNINSYFWTLNVSDDKKAYYIHNEGGINNDVGHNASLYSYGVRPVIYLTNDLIYSSGDGTLDNPYVIGINKELYLNKHPVGTYVLYGGYRWRSIYVNDEYTKLIMDGCIKENDDNVKQTYDDVYDYLNNTFINGLNKDDLVEIETISTEFNAGNNYLYNSALRTDKRYISLPIVSDLFVSDYDGCWLDTYYNTSQKLVYTTSNESSLLADLTNSTNYVRPIIAVKNDLMISDGNGIYNDPYVLGGNR